MNAPVRRILAAFILLYLGLYLAWLLVGPVRESERILAGNLALIFSSAACTWMSIRAWRSAAVGAPATLQAQNAPATDVRAARRAWAWLSAGAAAWLAGDILRLLQEEFNRSPSGQPDLLDFLFALGSLSLLAGLLVYPRRALTPRPRRRLRLLLDATVATTAILCLAWILVLAPIAAASTRLAALLYPAADLVLLLTLMNLFLLHEPGSFPAPLSWLVLALAAYATSDLAFASLLREGSYTAGALVDFGWTIGDGLFILAALAQIRRYPVTQVSSRSLTRRIAARVQALLPLVATLSLGWISIVYWQLTGSSAQLGPWATIVLGLVIIARQGIAAGEVEFEKYARLFDSIAEPAFICDREGQLRLVNPAFVQLTGYDQAQSMLGLPLHILIRPAQDVQRILTQGLVERMDGSSGPSGSSGSSGWSGIVQINRNDGQLVPTQLALRPVEWGRGGSALAGTAHDLSEINRQQIALQQAYEQLAVAHYQLERLNSELEQRVSEKTVDLKQAYEQLEIQNAALRSLDRLKSDFVSMVSHELRAPLTNINGGIELVLARARALSPDARETLSLVQAEIARLTQFVETILDLSALDAGRAPIYPAPLYLPNVVVALRRQMTHLAGVDRVQWLIPDDMPEILADERAVSSILFHLLDNALKYAPRGTIRISAGADAAGGWVRVEDEGDGIAAEDLPMLFTRFFRSRSSDAQTVYGHGLGLYIVKRLLEAMNGTIEVTNRPEGGGCFTCRLPLVVDERTGEGYEF